MLWRWQGQPVAASHALLAKASMFRDSVSGCQWLECSDGEELLVWLSWEHVVGPRYNTGCWVRWTFGLIPQISGEDEG